MLLLFNDNARHAKPAVNHHRASRTLLRRPCVECFRRHSVVNTSYIAELNASAQWKLGKPQTALVSTLNGTLDNTIGPNLIWDCPIDGDPLFEALDEPGLRLNTVANAPAIYR